MNVRSPRFLMLLAMGVLTAVAALTSASIAFHLHHVTHHRLRRHQLGFQQPQEVLREAARQVPCGEGCKGAVILAVSNAPSARTLHGWLIFANKVVPGGVGAPHAGVVVAAADTALISWANSRGVPAFFVDDCTWMLGRLAEITPDLSRYIGRRWCQAVAMSIALEAGFLTILMDTSVIPLHDPIPGALKYFDETPGGLFYQCGQPMDGVDSESLRAYTQWPSSTLMMAAPFTPASDVIHILKKEGKWQADVGLDYFGTWKTPMRPYVPCRPRLLHSQLAKVLGSTEFLCMMAPADTPCDEASYAVDQSATNRRARWEFAETIMQDYFSGILSARSFNLTLSAFCRKLPHSPWCDSPKPEWTHLPFYTNTSDLFDWVGSFCVDFRWIDEDVLREMLEPENIETMKLGKRISTVPKHKCLSDRHAVMAEDAKGEDMVMVHGTLKNADTVFIYGDIGLLGGTFKAAKQDLLPVLPCVLKFSGPTVSLFEEEATEGVHQSDLSAGPRLCHENGTFPSL